MPAAKVTSKGQVTIPVGIRRSYGIHEGTRLEFIPEADGAFRVVSKKRSIMDFRGFFTWDKPPLSIDDMNESLLEGVAQEYRRSVEPSKTAGTTR